MRGPPQTRLLAFSFLCLLSKVRGAQAPNTAGFPAAGGGVNSSQGLCWAQPGFPSVCPDSCLWPALCVPAGKSLPSEPQLLPHLNGHGVHEVFVKILFENSSQVSAQGLVMAEFRRTSPILASPNYPSTAQWCPPRK